ncbi:hypothetical protein ABNC64_07365 [Paenibacillus larvae]
MRADGTEKPEANVSYDFGRFMEACRDLFEDRKLEDVVVVFPYSNDLSNRSFAVEATSRLTRVLAHEMNVHFRAMGEYQLDALKDQPAKLIVLPSAHNLSESAFAYPAARRNTAGDGSARSDRVLAAGQTPAGCAG